MLAFAILATGAGWLLLASPWLRVRTVTVTGVDEPYKSEVQRAADSRMSDPLVKVDTAGLRDEIAAMRAVSRVDIARRWPDALVVSVTLRTPIAATANPQGTFELVDAEGRRYASVDKVPDGIPTVTLARADDPAEVASAVAVLTALDAGQRDSATDVYVASPEDVRFRLDDVLILWGGPSDGKVKAAVVAALVHREGVGTVNVSAPDAPVVTMRKAG
ncbi:MAG: FtsQ-type POTRA domain-containing protein [Dermatophilaceae bacterium]